MTRTRIDLPMTQSVAKRCDQLSPYNRHQPSRLAHDSYAAAHRLLVCPTLPVVAILIQRDHVDDEMPQRGRARIAGSAIAAPFGRVANCPPSVSVPCHSGSGFPGAGLCGDRYWRSGQPPYY